MFLVISGWVWPLLVFSIFSEWLYSFRGLSMKLSPQPLDAAGAEHMAITMCGLRYLWQAIDRAAVPWVQRGGAGIVIQGLAAHNKLYFSAQLQGVVRIAADVQDNFVEVFVRHGRHRRLGIIGEGISNVQPNSM